LPHCKQQGKSDSSAAAGSTTYVGSSIKDKHSGAWKWKNKEREEKGLYIKQLRLYDRVVVIFLAAMISNPPQETCPCAVGRLHKSICVGFA
jgi:hypothetical protein